MIREVSRWLESIRSTDDLPYPEMVRAGCQRIIDSITGNHSRPFVGILLPEYNYDFELDRIHIGTLFRVAAEWVSGYELRILTEGDPDLAQAAWLATCLDRDAAYRISRINTVAFIGADPIPLSKEKRRIRFEVFCGPQEPDECELHETIWVPDWYKPKNIPPRAKLISSSAWRAKYASAVESLGSGFGDCCSKTQLGTCEELQRVWFGNSTKSRSKYWLNLGEELRYFYSINRILGISNESCQNSRPLISVVIPVYDREDELVRLACSVTPSATCALEAVFVLNGSPPGTFRAVTRAVEAIKLKGCGARVIDLGEKCGCATVPRDVGSYAANGDWILFLDSDDYLEPNFFEHFPADSIANVLYPRKRFRNFGRDMGSEFPWNQIVGATESYDNRAFRDQLANHTNFIGNSGAAVRRDAFVRCGGILHSLNYCEDYYLWLALAEQGSSAHSHYGVVNIALHPGNNELAVGDSAWIQTARKRAAELVGEHTEVCP